MHRIQTRIFSINYNKRKKSYQDSRIGLDKKTQIAIGVVGEGQWSKMADEFCPTKNGLVFGGR